MESYAQRRREIWSHTRTRIRSRRATGIQPPAPSSSSSTPETSRSPRYNVAQTSSSGSRLRYPVAAGDFVPSSSSSLIQSTGVSNAVNEENFARAIQAEGLAFISDHNLERRPTSSSLAQSARVVSTPYEEESMSGSQLAVAFEPYSRNVSRSRLPSYLLPENVSGFHTPHETFSGSHDAYGYFSDAPNLTLPTSSESHAVWVPKDPVDVAESHGLIENQRLTDNQYAMESRDTTEDTADGLPKETPIAQPAPAWFFTRKVQTSKNIWAPDCEGERRLTDWPSFNELIDAGDGRALRGKERRLPIPRYRNVDARLVHRVENGDDDPTAFATTTAPVPFLFRKYAVDLAESENWYPIPCDYNEEEARRRLHTVDLN
ncbi:hypothetical protein PG993_007882 [Apiospora rasikravindrae]|uniref:Uncharacterized protein n=1 Tax=Apiospora rasikravindrae TaxID=990691 RepID=A0ABR1T057_9PEZI